METGEPFVHLELGMLRRAILERGCRVGIAKIKMAKQTC
jgi:hypothetical protein